MYKMLRIFIVTFVLLCDIRVIISKPLSEEQQELNVEGLNSNRGIINDRLIKSVVIHRDPAEFLHVFHEDNSDTKKHYYLIKINEYYDFLPLHRNEDNHQLRLEIVDNGDMNHHVIKNDDSRNLVKREISDNTLKDSVNLLQTNFMGKRSVANTNFKGKFAQCDLGNFYRDPGQITTGIDLQESEDESKMNFKYFAYVPFFRVRKYYLQQNLLDYKIYED